MVLQWLLRSQWKADSTLEVPLTPYFELAVFKQYQELRATSQFSQSMLGVTDGQQENPERLSDFPLLMSVAEPVCKPMSLYSFLDLCLPDCLYISYSVIMPD